MRRATLVVAACATLGCRERAESTSTQALSASPAAAASAAPAPGSSGSPSSGAREPERRVDDEKDEATGAGAPDAGGSALLLDDLGDCGPAAAAVATPFGVALVDKADEVALAPLGKLPSGKKPGACAVSPVLGDKTQFLALARPPAATETHVYWISSGRLVRRSVTGGEIGSLEVLAEDAVDGTEVAAPALLPNAPAIAGYIGRAMSPDAPTRARLWVDGAGVRDLTVDGAAASSVAIGEAGDHWVAVSIEGRSGMSPVHTRLVLAKGGVTLGEDVVAWVAGPAHPLTRAVVATTAGGDSFALVPLERDIARFGLAQVALGREPAMNAAVTWRAYPNGLEPAAMATARVCGAPHVIYATPADATRGAPQELRLARLETGGLGPPSVIGRARAFSTLSMAAIAEGALIAWVADWRTWTRTVRCR